jgi:galactonate dehydratase
MVKELKIAKEKGFTAVGHLSPFLDEPRTEPFNEGTFAKNRGCSGKGWCITRSCRE